jgi:Uma2 family endonuclease
VIGLTAKERAMTIMMPRHRFTTEDYEQMVAIGILDEDDRVELIDGEIITMSPIGPLHVDGVAILDRLIRMRVPNDVLVLVQSPIQLPNNSQPQPDITLVRYDRYRGRLPAPDDIFVVIEVSDSTLAFDRDTKLPLYAAAGIPEAWLVDLTSGIIERHAQPGSAGYRTILRAGRGEELTSLTLPALTVAVDAIFS